ncbi:MAG: DUF3426 domain-containing protein [Pseudolabrys sp.]
MLIVCPSCATSYMVEPGSLGPAGRMVRCARCKTAWFAGAPEAKADVDGFVENVIAEAEGRPVPPTGPRAATPPPPPPRHDEPAYSEPAADEFGAEPNAPIASIGHAPAVAQVPNAAHSAEPPPQEMQPDPVSDAPSLVPAAGYEPLRRGETDADDAESFAARRARMQAKRKTMRRSSKWTALILVLVGFNVAVIGARSEVVRYLPQTASLFSAIGLPVNLRQLAFENVKISNEEADGASVLVVEGAIASRSGKPVEVPRIRFAVRNASGQEIYSWSAMPSRSILPAGEKLPFRSRLASPPADASDVVVRFFTARDPAPDSK